MNMKILSKLLLLVFPAIIMARYPFIQNLSVASLNYEGGYLVISGTMDVYFTDQAWAEFGYKDSNFYWFNEWWQDQIGNRYGPFKLVSITWDIIVHTETYDRLAFVVVLEPKAHIRV